MLMYVIGMKWTLWISQVFQQTAGI